MPIEVKEVLTAFVDGEPVDPGELASALAEPGAREAVLDFMLLRARLLDAAEPSSGFVDRMRGQLGERSGGIGLRRSLRLVAAAAILALAGVGALDLMQLVHPAHSDDPPEPTRVIRYEPGVDWRPLDGR